ncbi:MAG: hypothetical protein KC422_21470 [Trueperaceae bacterium]|nr:hypothetical protein [Trueperaceae bacterium]
MKRIVSTLSLSFLAACSFAPLSIPVANFYIASGSSATLICYSKVSKAITVQFASVVYEGDALYQPGQGLGDNSTVELQLYGRASDPDPGSSAQVKCVNESAEDILLSSTPISLVANEQKRVFAGGSSLAQLVSKNEYYLGGSLNDGTIFGFPGRIDFTDGVVKANF